MDQIITLVTVLFYAGVLFIGYGLLVGGPSKHELAKLEYHERVGARIMLVIIKGLGALLIYYACNGVYHIF